MTTFEPTKSGLKALLQDIASAYPDKIYYAVAECTETGPVYYEITFRTSRLWGPVFGHLSAQATLAHYGRLTDHRPRDARNIATDPSAVPQKKRGAKSEKVTKKAPTAAR